MRSDERPATPGQRRRQRESSEAACRLAQVRLIVTASLLRTSLTEIVPQMGSASWWVVPVCLVPGIVVYYAVVFMLKAGGMSSLEACAERVLSAGGRRLAGSVAGVLLALETASNARMLPGLFTGGINAEGERWAIVLIAGVAVSLCLSREGLTRCISFHRRILLAMLVLVGINAAELARPSGLYPLLGNGLPGIRTWVRMSLRLGWPFLLLLWEKIEGEGQPQREPFLPVLVCASVTLMLVLAMPHEWLTAAFGPPEALLVLAPWLHAPVRMLLLILSMLVLFLAATGSADMAAVCLSGNEKNTGPWAVGVAAAAFAAAMIVEGGSRQSMEFLRNWLAIVWIVGMLILAGWAVRTVKKENLP